MRDMHKLIEYQNVIFYRFYVIKVVNICYISINIVNTLKVVNQ